MPKFVAFGFARPGMDVDGTTPYSMTDQDHPSPDLQEWLSGYPLPIINIISI
jgi:hypothetical protein